LLKPVEGTILGSLIKGKRGYPAMADEATQDGGRDTDATATRSTDGPPFALARPLPPALLYHRCPAADLPFALSSELKEVPGLIGQERAVEAISLAMRMRGKGYNVYALGRAAPAGTARLRRCCANRQRASRPRQIGAMSTILTIRKSRAGCACRPVGVPGSPRR
jgi:hypothetical protein